MTPTWYDVLDLDPDATEAEIRAAWKAAIADLDPGDRRFRTCNRAAEVLLDPARRAAYDAELAAQAEPVEGPAEDSAEDAVGGPGDEPVEDPADERALPGEPAADDPASFADTDDRSGEVPDAGRSPHGPRRVVPAWLLAVVALLTAASVAVAAWQWQRPSDDAVADAVRAAQAAAERAVPPVLSYDAADLAASRSAAAPYLTSSYQKERDELFDEVIATNAPSTGTKVATSVVDSSVVRATDDDRVQVFLFIDQATTNKARPEPQVVRTWVTMTMEKVDGEWLVAAMRVV